jgi:hypothetical protein
VKADSFIGEEVQVEQAPGSPRPVRFVWRDDSHEVTEVLLVRVDTGFGGLPARSRRWYTRRHRRYYGVKDASGAIFEMYLDYADKSHRRWFLTRRLQHFP